MMTQKSPATSQPVFVRRIMRCTHAFDFSDMGINHDRPLKPFMDQGQDQIDLLKTNEPS